MTDQPATRRAGRPPKNPNTADTAKVEGLVKTPRDDSHLVELFITRPTIFKKLLLLFDDCDANYILLTFTKSHFYMRSFKPESNIVVENTIFGHECNRYYCEKEVSMYVECDVLLRLNSYIEPEYDYDFELSVVPGINKKVLQMLIINKTNRQEERLDMHEMKPSDIQHGPNFNEAELMFPIAFKAVSKSFKRKFTGLVKNYSPEARFLNDPIANTVIISAQSTERTSSYELMMMSHETEGTRTANEIMITINIKPLKFFLKNAVDENTTFFINEDKVVCLSADLGKVKTKGRVIGITKLYYWAARTGIMKYLPESERTIQQETDEPGQNLGSKRSTRRSTKGTKNTKNAGTKDPKVSRRNKKDTSDDESDHHKKGSKRVKQKKMRKPRKDSDMDDSDYDN